MPNPNYIKGRRKEYKICSQERKLGRLAFRSAGSHSPVDVVSVNKKDKVIRFIQCKPDDFSKKAELKLLEKHREINGVYYVQFEVL